MPPSTPHDAATRYDTIIIGAGQGGGPLASALAQSGERVALIERKHVGGTCVNEGCTPTKTMVATARVAHRARRATDYGVDAGPVTVDMQAVRARKRRVVEDFRSGSRKSIEETDGLDLIEGEAAFTGKKTIAVHLQGGDRETFEADRIVINTGARPFIPPIDGLMDIDFLDSTSIMELGEVPEHLLVLGGGYIGLEFGQMFRRFGSRVTIIQRGDQLLSREDEDVAGAVAEILEAEGINVQLSAETTRAEKQSDGGVRLTVEQNGDTHTLGGSHLLVATGRRPNTDDLGLDAAGVETDERGHVQVNGRLETRAEGVYAIGDVKGGPAFTHISYDDYRILRGNFLHEASRTTRERLVPYTVFIDPQLGRVGLTEKQADEQGCSYEVARLPMQQVARAIETDETRGFMKVLVDPDTEQILGVAILGKEGGEVMSVLQVAMMGALPYTAIRDGTFAHPTLAESLNNLFATLDG